MKKAIVLGAVLMALAAPAQAGLGDFLGGNKNKNFQLKVGSSVMPPAGFQGRRWVHPNGCQYSRTGRPTEVTWTLVATGMKGCSRFFVQYSPHSDMNSLR